MVGNARMVIVFHHFMWPTGKSVVLPSRELSLIPGLDSYKPVQPVLLAHGWGGVWIDGKRPTVLNLGDGNTQSGVGMGLLMKGT